MLLALGKGHLLDLLNLLTSRPKLGWYLGSLRCTAQPPSEAGSLLPQLMNFRILLLSGCLSPTNSCFWSTPMVLPSQIKTTDYCAWDPSNSTDTTSSVPHRATAARAARSAGLRVARPRPADEAQRLEPSCSSGLSDWKEHGHTGCRLCPKNHAIYIWIFGTWLLRSLEYMEIL